MIRLKRLVDQLRLFLLDARDEAVSCPARVVCSPEGRPAPVVVCRFSNVTGRVECRCLEPRT